MAAMADAFDSARAAVNARFDDMRELWRAELRRAEEVLGVRLTHLEQARKPVTMKPMDAFDDAIERMRNAHHTARDAYLDADAALTVSLQAMRDATAAHGSLSQQLADMKETILQLQTIVLQQTKDIRELRQKP